MAGTIPRARRRRPLLLAAGMVLLGAACAEDPGPWRRLAGPLAPGEALVLAAEGGREVRLVHDGEHAWAETDVVRGRWEAGSPPGVFTASLPDPGRGKLPEGRPYQRLTAAGRRFELAPEGPVEGWPAGSFRHEKDRLVLRLAPGEEPPARAVFACLAAGRREAALARVRGRRFTGAGFSVWPGERLVRRLDVPPDSSLRLATCVDLGGSREPEEPVRFRVLLDGAPLLDAALEAAPEGAHAWHVLDLPPEGCAGAELAFEVSGPAAVTSFLDPVVGPRDAAARRDADGRPNLVLFLADTFRADGLAVYGGKLGATPFLDELAERSVVFRRTWSTGTFTLPAHVSLFTARYPHQAGIIGTGQALPDELTTVAEQLAAAGYRTGAVTDSVIVSQNYGMDHGFEFFDELKPNAGTLEETFERACAFLDGGDGRPTFLFVHTYRTHLPYRVSEETRRERGIGGDFRSLDQRLQGFSGRELDAAARSQRDAVVRELEALYRGGMADLDRGLRGFHERLVERGLVGDRGCFVFTSDHGEAFHEHDVVYHTGRVWEELARVPLLLSGPGLEPEVRDVAASIVDLPRTLCDLAGVRPAPDWLGASLVDLHEDRPVYVFECQRPPASTLALIEGPHKVISFEEPQALAAGRLFGAFDLDRDPGERQNLLRERTIPWPRALLARHRARLAELLVPVVGPKAAELDPEKLAELEAMGYAGESDE